MLPNVKTLSYARNYPLLATINIGLTRNGSVCILPMICRSEEQIKEYVHQKRIIVAVFWVLPLPGNDYSVSLGTSKRKEARKQSCIHKQELLSTTFSLWCYWLTFGYHCRRTFKCMWLQIIGRRLTL